MDPFRVGLLVVGVSAAALLLAIALPALIQVILSIVPNLLILLFVFWVVKAFIKKILS